jgi:pimeloyl-ACP methyl ester carboxylesterase
MMTATLLALALAAGAAGAGPAVPREGDAKSFDAIKIQYRVEGRGESKGSPTLVFVHCWSCDGHYWDAQVPHFARHYSVVTLDLAGHGRSGKSRSDWTVESFGRDVEAVVRHLDLKRVVLIGHSMGGPVVLEAARRMPDRVAGLVPVDTLLDVDDHMTPDKIEEYLAPFAVDFKASTDKFARGFMFTPTSPPALIEAIVREASASDPAVAIPALRNTWAYDAATALDAVKVPIVAVNADKWPTNLAAARRHAPQFDAVLVKGVGHYLMRENPEGFNRALEEALRRMGVAAR